MPEDIGHFRVVIEGKVDKKLGESLEKEIKDSSKKAGKHLETELEKGLKKVFKSNSFTKFLEENFKISNKISKMFEGKTTSTTLSKPGAVYQSMTNVEHLQPLSPKGEAASATKGTENNGSTLKNLLGELISIGMKISVIGVILKLAGDVLKGLAPTVALWKGAIAILQLTLYPLTTFILAIFKPILIMLLKYVILPFYYKVMPILEALGKWIGETVAGILKDPVGAIQGLWAFVVEGTLKILGILWEKIKEIFAPAVTYIVNVFSGIIKIIEAAFKIISGLLFDWSNFIITVFSGMVQNIINVLTFLAKTLLGVLNVLLSPFINLITRIIKNPLDAIGAFADFGSEIAHTGDRIGEFAQDVQTNWKQLQNDTLKIITNIKNAGIQIFSNLATNVKNYLSIIGETISYTTFGMSDKAVSAFGVIASSFNTMISSMEARVQAQSTMGGVSYGKESVPSWASSTIRAAISAQGSVRYANPMAEGGIVNTPTIALIGEKGSEAVIPLNKMGSMGGTTIVNVSFPNMIVEKNIDIDDIVSKIERTFYTNSKRAGI